MWLYIQLPRLHTIGKDSAFYGLLRSPTYQKVWENNVNINKTFNSDIYYQMQLCLNQSNAALIWVSYSVHSTKGYECKVKIFLPNCIWCYIYSGVLYLIFDIYHWAIE